MRPTLNAQRKIRALERRKALLDALILFLRKHPNVAAASTLKPLANRTGLYFCDFAIIRPLWVKDHVVLRLERYFDEMFVVDPDSYDGLDRSKQAVHADVTNVSDEELEELLTKLEQEEEQRRGG
jgi:hypothetical protein